MDTRLEKLRQLGCGIDEAMDRFMNDEQLYLSCFENLLVDESFEKLGSALQNGDLENAFHYAHMLKSVYANMGMDPIYKDCVVIVEAARDGNFTDDLLQSYDRMKAFMEKIKQI